MSLVVTLPPHADEAIRQFLRVNGEPPESNGYVVGLSGGIDSALTARLARDAVGADRVLALLIPDSEHPTDLETDTQSYARELGIEERVLRIHQPETALESLVPPTADRVTRGNFRARLRMAILYAFARDTGRRVLGTGNKSEILLGYFTKHGDGGVDLLPLGDLYKTQVRQLARALALPQKFLDRVPTAGFWAGQTDEGELGHSYDDLDRILLGLERLWRPEEIANALNLPRSVIDEVAQRVAVNRHKRRLPPIPKLSLRTVGIDWRD
ncbi:MAG: NAD+ synthase [Thermoplasmata archaeon]